MRWIGKDRQINGHILSGTEIFGNLAEEALDHVTRVSHRRPLAAGSSLFRQGDPADAFCVLLEGGIKMVQISPEGQQVVLRYIGPGEMFGAVALFCRTDYPATAVAVTDGLAAIWSRDTAEMLLRRYPEIGANALQVVGGRLQELQSRYRELSTENVERRVARTLLRLAARPGRPVADDTRIDFPISRQDIAEMTGTTLHTVSRVISRWEGLGLVASGRMALVLRRPQALSRIADDL